MKHLLCPILGGFRRSAGKPRLQAATAWAIVAISASIAHAGDKGVVSATVSTSNGKSVAVSITQERPGAREGREHLPLGKFMALATEKNRTTKQVYGGINFEWRSDSKKVHLSITDLSPRLDTEGSYYRFWLSIPIKDTEPAHASVLRLSGEQGTAGINFSGDSAREFFALLESFGARQHRHFINDEGEGADNRYLIGEAFRCYRSIRTYAFRDPAAEYHCSIRI